MAEAELDAAVIKRTQETLGKYVKKPPLTEKLLKKPPFRFLYDVFKVVIKDTGYFEGLYTPDELNFENIKDRDDKMRFLQKMIDVVKLTTEKSLNVRTSKIVAGHEAERTNELLQLMGEIIEKEMDWQKAVKTVVTTGTGAETAGAQANGTVVKERKEGNKDAKAKEKEKPKENGKFKEKEKPNAKTVGNKENKPKEGQSKKSTPSPVEKTVKKTIKTAPKEKVLSRQATIEKISKEKDKEKEKGTKKSKDSKDVEAAAKTKDERKRVTPSPVKQAASKTTTTTQNNNNNVKEHTKNTKQTNESVKDMQVNEALTKQQSMEKIESSSKPNSFDNEATLTTKNEVVEKAQMPEPIAARESSANQARQNATSSGTNRKSSASKQKPIENMDSKIEDEPQNTTLKAVNEVEVTTRNETQKAEEQQQPQRTTTTPQPPMQPMPAAKEFKREPTFTHENSRDSVGSNSNSSSNRPRTSLRPPSARPPSARPGAPRRRDKNVEIILQPNDQIKMSNINVKLETFGDLDDDGENLVIIEDATTSADNLLHESNDINKLETEKLEQQGHLVQQILETQKELVQQNGDIGLKGEKDNLELGFDANTRQSSARQMNNLRDIIQSLTKSVNPFGKLMDFIPEDIDAMQLELNMWRDNYTQAASDLKREKSLTESATEPMKNQLIQIDANIKEYLEMIDASRVKILQNSDKILKMLLEQ